MTLSDFWLSVIASIIASIIVAIAAKITLEKWKELVIGFGATLLVAVFTGLVVFAGITVTRTVSDYFARSSLQEKITAYTKGHYPEEVKKGYGVDVLEIRQRVFLGLNYPDNEAYPTPHPLNNAQFTDGITKLLNDNGFPGSPVWAYQMKPASAEQMEKLLAPK
ncbi:hypothetical protein IFU01_13175 [Oxalobacteraceae sp. CFBP 8763]|nr:hypothetical protein [Oxalobacteraceae sp. CFBP 8763]